MGKLFAGKEREPESGGAAWAGEVRRGNTCGWQEKGGGWFLWPRMHTAV